MLFDKEGIYDITNIPMEFELSINKDNKEFIKVYDLDKALSHGNLFPSLYDPYKNKKPKRLEFSSKHEQMLHDIRKLIFGINDLNLYLDLNPDDSYAYNLFKDFTNKLIVKEKEFNESFGPLKLSDLKEKYDWVNHWPWGGNHV